MRTKLFFAFFAVIAMALVSNLIYEQLVVRDFEAYVGGAKADKLYWILASVEGSYTDGRWDIRSLHNAAHWAAMLGFDIRITDKGNRELMSSRRALEMLSPSMKRRMQGITDLESATGDYEQYPLYGEGREVGTLYARTTARPGRVSDKEQVFRRKGREFLITSFVIAGSGAVLLAVFFSLFLARPLKHMKRAVEALAQGNFSARVATTSDRDELGKLSKSFNFMAEALEREEALRKRLTSNIAHELRTPLAVAKANVEAMIDGVVEDRQSGLENVRLEIERLIGLVEGIEDITKAEASFFSKNKYTLTNLADFLDGIVAKLTPLAAERGLSLQLTRGEDRIVLTDQDKLERIIQNIVTNALKNTLSGGVTLSYASDATIFSVEVRDTGVGIPEDKKDLIFKRFYRGDDSTGIGLGLAIVKELADALGGGVDFRSRVGEGSVFTVRLPLHGK